QYTKERTPGVVPYANIDSEVLADLEQNPIMIDPSGSSLLNRAELVTENDLSDIYARKNSDSRAMRLNGTLQIKTSRTTNLSIGGRWNYTNAMNESFANHIFNYKNNLNRIDSRWGTFVRF